MALVPAALHLQNVEKFFQLGRGSLRANSSEPSRTAFESIVEDNVGLIHLIGADIGLGAHRPGWPGYAHVGHAALVVDVVVRVVADVDPRTMAEQGVGFGQPFDLCIDE